MTVVSTNVNAVLLNIISLVHVKAFIFVLSYESWQNDICSFGAMTVALTLSFKLISF